MMVANHRRPLVAAACAVVFLAIVFLVFQTHASHPSTETIAGDHGSTSKEELLEDLLEPKVGLQDGEHDFGSYGLPEKTCSSEFGSLFQDIERAVAHRMVVGNVNEADINLDWKGDGAVRAMIYQQKLYILESKIEDDFMISRALSTLHQIDRAIATSPEPLPNIEFSFLVRDIPDDDHQQHVGWALSRMEKDEKLWLMPDFGYWSWPVKLIGNYEQVRAEIKATESSWEQKIPKALWRGTVKTNKVRESLMSVSQGKSWADIEEVKWRSRTSVTAGSANLALSMVDHCNYQYLIHTEGRSYSGRGKYLLNCESVTIAHKSEWIEPHHSVLVSSGPEQNFVQVERDFSDLEAKMEQLLHEPSLAKTIAQNSAKTFRDRYLTPAAQACYWRHLIRSWAKVSFHPKPWVRVDGKRHIRGVPFETFVVQIAFQNSCSTWQKILKKC